MGEAAPEPLAGRPGRLSSASPAVDVYRAEAWLEGLVPAVTLRTWARRDGWVPVGSVAKGKKLWAWRDVFASAQRRGRLPVSLQAAPPPPPVPLPAEFGGEQPDGDGLILCPRCLQRVPLEVALEHVRGVRSGTLVPLARDPKSLDPGDERAVPRMPWEPGPGEWGGW